MPSLHAITVFFDEIILARVTQRAKAAGYRSVGDYIVELTRHGVCLQSDPLTSHLAVIPMINKERWKGVVGIYQILNNDVQRVYIGSSIDIFNRLDQHHNQLRSGTHHNRYLQSDWSMQQGKGFKIGILDMLARSEDAEPDIMLLRMREQIWIDRARVVYGPRKVYNHMNSSNSAVLNDFSGLGEW